MNDLIAFLLIIACFVAYVWYKDTVRKSIDVMVPRDIQKAAQRSADLTARSQVVVFDGSTHEIRECDKQYSARGMIVQVFHPVNPERIAPRNIYVGACLKPNPAIEVYES